MRELSADEKLELLLNYAGQIAEAKDLDKILYTIATLGKLLIGVDRCTVWLLNADSNTLWTKVAHGIPRVEIPADTGVVGHAVKTGEVVMSNDPYNLPFFNSTVDKKTGYHTESLLTLPLFNDVGEVFGAFQCVNKLSGSKQFCDEDARMMRLIADYSEKSLLTAMLAIEIEKTQVEVILLMSEIAESRSKVTGNHVKRVAQISYELATRCGIPEDQAQLLKVASPMHDIGKVAIPDRILNKPGKLTADEFDIIKTHAEIGYNLLKNSNRPIIKAAATIAREHHEKWNGTGYPRGLKGEEIHIFGRISAIADVFDALAANRCYKDAWPMPKIIELFEKEKGEHFDPALTQIFLDNFAVFRDVLATYADEDPELSFDDY